MKRNLKFRCREREGEGERERERERERIINSIITILAELMPDREEGSVRDANGTVSSCIQLTRNN